MIMGFLLLGVIAIVGLLVGILIKIFVPCITVIGYTLILSIIGIFLLGLISAIALII